MLFGPRGAYGGGWCMWWRLTRKVFEQQVFVKVGFEECAAPSNSKRIMRYVMPANAG